MKLRFVFYICIFFIFSITVMAKVTVLTDTANLVYQANSTNNAKLIDDFREITKKYPENIPLDILHVYYDTIGPEKMLDVVEEDPFCHGISHNIGRVVFTKTDDLQESMNICKRRCTDGCLHGVLMSVFSNKNKDNHTHETDEPHSHVTVDYFKSQVLSFCDTPPMNTHAKGDCYHALGHVAMFLADYDVAKGIGFCKIFKNKVATYYCATGAYMERSLVYGNTDEYLFPCDVHKDFPAACYRYKFTSRFTRNLSYTDVAETCLALTDKQQRLGCFHGYGFKFFSLVSNKPDFLPTLCSFGNKKEQRMCIEGAAGKLQLFSKSKRSEACSYVDRKLKEACMRANNQGMDRDMHLYYYTYQKNVFSLILSFFKEW